MSEGPETAVASSPGRRSAEEWALVLAAEGLAPTVRHDGHRYVLLVPPEQADRAAASLEEYARERRAAEAPPPPTEVFEGDAPLVLAVAVSGALLLFFAVTGPWREGSPWFEAGAAHAGRIQAGEVWRLVTALTLHADLGHVVANALTGALFGAGVARALGPGVAAAAILGSGAAGNGLNALLRAGDHVSVGASTAVFGAVGLLGGLGRGAVRAGRSRRIAVTLAASLGLLAMLGTGGERTDLWAHGLGLSCGLALGVALGRGPARPPRTGWQVLLGLVAAGAVAASWLAARGAA